MLEYRDKTYNIPTTLKNQGLCDSSFNKTSIILSSRGFVLLIIEIVMNIEELNFEQEEILKNIHADEYFGTDDDMYDDYERWLCSLTEIQISKYLGLKTYQDRKL